MILFSKNIIAKIKLLLVLFFVSVYPDSHSLFSQDRNIIFDHLSSADGLSSGAIISIFQDSKGYMWFGTYDGLNMYNGHEIKVYSHDENDPNSISNSYINAIVEDSNGNILVGTNDGLNSFDRHAKNFSRVVFDTSSNEPIQDAIDYILDLQVDGDYIWIGTHGGLYKINSNELVTGGYVNYEMLYFPLRRLNLEEQKSSIGFLHKDKKGELWMKNYSPSIFKYDNKKDSFINQIPQNTRNIIPNNPGMVVMDDQGIFWLRFYPDKLLYFDKKKLSTVSPYPGLKENITIRNINHVLNVSDSKMWIATDGYGLYRYNLNTGKVENEKANLADPKSLSSNKISSLFKDRQNIIWVGTVNNGLNIFNPRKSKFNHIYPIPGDNKKLKSKGIISFTEDHQGHYWIGTEGEGFTRYNPARGTFTYNGDIDQSLNVFEEDIIKSIFTDSKGHLWILAYLHGLFKYNPANGELEQYQYSPETGENYYFHDVWSINEDNLGRVWVGTLHSGLYMYNRNRKSFTEYNNNPDDANSIPHQGILCIHIDENDILWIGTYNGMAKANLNNIDPTSPHPELHFKTSNYNENTNSISSNRVIVITGGMNGSLLIGTETGGMNIYHPGENKFTIIGTKQGLPGDKVNGIATDKKSRIWVTTNMGLSCIEPDLKGIYNYNAKDGIQSNNCKTLFKSNDGHFFLGGIYGFNYFLPEEINVDSNRLELYLTSFKIFDQEVLPGHEFNGRVILEDLQNNKGVPILKHNENSLKFEFLAIDYLNPTKIMYKYKLDGFDKKWISSGDRRFATYTNLPPEKYVFRVKSTNSSGIWNQGEVSFPFEIKPPIWKTTGAYILYVFVIIFLIILGRYLTIKEIKIRNDLKLEQLKRENEQEINQLKLTFFTNISHELRTPLTLIAGPVNKLYHTAKEKNWGSEILQQFSFLSRNVNRLTELTSQLLDMRKLEMGKMKIELQVINLNEYVKQMVENFEHLAASKNIAFTSQSNITEDNKVNMDTDKVTKILSNLLSNAIKFTPEKGKVIFNTSYSDELFIAEVRDTGIGIDKENLPHIFDRFYQAKNHDGNKTRGTGIGLALTRDLVKLLNGEIMVNSIEGVGTDFTVKIPAKKSENVVHDQPHPITNYPCESLIEETSTDPGAKDENITLEDSSKENILIVDDNADMLAYIRSFLSPRYRVQEARNGKIGLETAMETIPDLILSDIMMPDMDGIEMGKILKSDARTSHIPFILLTALSATDTKLEGLQTGADDYITKPFNEEILLLKVKNQLQSRENLRHYFSSRLGLAKDARGEKKLPERDVQVNEIDRDFMMKIQQIIENNLENVDFGVKKLATEVGMGNTQLYMKLKALINTSPGNYIIHARLVKAREMLQEGKYNVNEVAYKVGFSDPKYFSKCFKKHFGRVPSYYL